MPYHPNRRDMLLGMTTGAAAALARPMAAQADNLSADALIARDFAARQAEAAVQTQPNTTAQRPYIATYSLIVGMGESNMQGDQGAWAGAATPEYGNVMLGNGTRPILAKPLTNPAIDLFQPVGGQNVLTPLQSINQSNKNGIAVPVNQGGFDSIMGSVFSGPPHNTIDVSAATATAYVLTNGQLVATPVGGPGEPPFDLTQVFGATYGVWITGLSGSTLATQIDARSTMKVTSVTPTVLTISSPGGLLNGTPSTPFNLSVTNNYGAFGEDACVTQANDYAAAANAAGTLPAGVSWGVLNVATAGVSAKEISPGQSPDLYNRAIDGVTRFVNAAAALGQNAYVVADVYEQGGTDSTLGTSQNDYTNYVATIYNAHRTDYPGITGQSAPPLFLISQTSGNDLDATDTNNDAISMAQLSFCTSGNYPDAYCLGPTYYAPNQGAHETANGQRWKGAMRAKIMYNILALNQGWLPLYPTAVTYTTNQVQITFYVPVGNLQFRPSYKSCTPTMYKDAGFKATDANGVNKVVSVQITGASTLVINCARAFVSPPAVQYADAATHGGIGNLYDSDPAVSSTVFSFTPYSGDVPIEQIPAFVDHVLTGQTFPSPVGQPYALFNPCCLFYIVADPA